MPRKLSNVVETCHISHLSRWWGFFCFVCFCLFVYSSFMGRRVWGWYSVIRRDLIFPLRMHWLDSERERDRGWGLFQPAWFAVMGDGSLQPSENHALWNSKPSLYYFQVQWEKWARGTVSFCDCCDQLLYAVTSLKIFVALHDGAARYRAYIKLTI